MMLPSQVQILESKDAAKIPLSGALPLLRACGTRSEGGLYLEVGIGWDGVPVQDFLVDPPKRVYPRQGFPLPTQGMGCIIDPHGTWHLIDRVGLCHYPYPADFVEEARRLGVSRRMQQGMKLLMLHGKPVAKGTKGAKAVSVFSLLSKESRLLLVHDRAFIQNYQDYLTGCSSSPKHAPETGTSWDCPKNIEAHHPVHFHPGGKTEVSTCAGLWWQDYPAPGQKKPENGSVVYLGEDPRGVGRMVGSTYFNARCRPPGTVPEYGGPAIFMSLPIGRFVVVKSASLDADAAVLATAAQGAFPASLVKD